MDNGIAVKVLYRVTIGLQIAVWSFGILTIAERALERQDTVQQEARYIEQWR